MKRISVALASALAVLVVGTAAARVPVAPAKKVVVAPDRTVPAGPTKASAALDPGGSVVVDDSFTVLRRAADLLPGGLPPVLADILAGLPVAGDALDTGSEDGITPGFGGVPFAPSLGLTGEAPAPEATPAAEPEPAPETKPALPPRRVQAQADLFPGLPSTGHAAYSNGATIHVDALTAGPTTLANADVAFSGATFTSAALSGVLANEMLRIVSPQLGAGAGYGRGSGVEVGLAQGPSADPQITLADKAEAKSPPSTDLIEKQTGPIDTPAFAARLLQGQAQSRAAAACTTGVDLSYGKGLAADVSLVGGVVDTTADDPTRGVSQSTSRTFLVPQEGSTAGPIAKFGISSEVRQTIAPVQITDALKLEFLGEWVLRATADGKKGTVHYGPGEVSPETPVIKIFNGADSIISVTLQQLLGPTGLTIPIPGVAELTIGEDARAIGGNADSKATETATLASGAVDIVRVNLLDGAGADLRIGHMEAAAAVPAGGIECGIGLLKKADRDSVKVGENFVWTVTVSNPNDCVLSSVKVVDTITTTPGIVYTIGTTEPKATSTTKDSVTWTDVGPIQPGGKKDLLINMSVSKDSQGGRFTDNAVATGICGPASGQAGNGVPLEARVSLNLPEILQTVQAVAELPRTGGLSTALPAMLLTSLGLGLRRMTRKRQGE